MSGPGLKQMKAAAKPGECPFCGDPIPPRKVAAGRPPTYCLDPICKTAWFRCWRRDRREPKQHVVPRVVELSWRCRRRQALSAGQRARWAS